MGEFDVSPERSAVDAEDMVVGAVRVALVAARGMVSAVLPSGSCTRNVARANSWPEKTLSRANTGDGDRVDRPYLGRGRDISDGADPRGGIGRSCFEIGVQPSKRAKSSLNGANTPLMYPSGREDCAGSRLFPLARSEKIRFVIHSCRMQDLASNLTLTGALR